MLIEPRDVTQSPPGPELSLSEIARSAIETLSAEGALPKGAVLLEGPIADRLGMSRAPVRTALQNMEKDGMVHRFDGRGYVLGDAADAGRPVRVNLREIAWPDVSEHPTQRRDKMASDTVLDNLQDAITGIIAFGRFRISEAALAANFNVSRAVAREALFHLLKRGLVEKDLRSHWITGPLTAQATRDLFAIRAVLEPLALRSAAPHFSQAELAASRQKLEQLSSQASRLEARAFDDVERELHEDYLSKSPNKPLLLALTQTRLPTAANKSFVQAMGALDATQPLAEHAAIFDALVAEDVPQACLLLERHVLASADRTARRLKLLSILPYPKLPDYITEAQESR